MDSNWNSNGSQYNYPCPAPGYAMAPECNQSRAIRDIQCYFFLLAATLHFFLFRCYFGSVGYCTAGHSHPITEAETGQAEVNKK